MTNTSTPTAIWTRNGFLRGCRLALPYGGSSFVYGLAFGLLAAQTGLSVAETIAMSAFVFSGTAQVAVLQSWAHSLSLLAIAITVLLVNVRYVLMGATLRQWLAPLGGFRASVALLSIVDGTYALGIREHERGSPDVGILAGAGFLSWLCWVLGSATGILTGSAIPNPKTLGLDFVVVAFCATTVTMMFGVTRDYVPAITAALAVIACEMIVPGPWSVIAAGLTAAVVAAARFKPNPAQVAKLDL